MPSKYKFSRIKGNTIWEVESNSFGPFYFTFDKKTIYNFWEDYEKLTDEQREIFDREYPVMAHLKNPNVVVPEFDDDDENEGEDYEPEYEYSN